MTKKQEEAIKILSDSKILMNIQRDTSLSIRVAIETVLNMLKEKDKEIEKKDKIIDLMAEVFYKKFKAELLLEYGFENEKKIKKYFKEIAERKREE